MGGGWWSWLWWSIWIQHCSFTVSGGHPHDIQLRSHIAGSVPAVQRTQLAVTGDYHEWWRLVIIKPFSSSRDHPVANYPRMLYLYDTYWRLLVVHDGQWWWLVFGQYAWTVMCRHHPRPPQLIFKPLNPRCNHGKVKHRPRTGNAITNRIHVQRLHTVTNHWPNILNHKFATISHWLTIMKPLINQHQ